LRLNFCSKLALVVAWAAPLCGSDSPEAVFRKASSALQNQNYKEAEAGFQAVLKLEPANVGALGNLGVVYSRTQRYTQAIEVYKRALRVAPGDKALLTDLGLAYVKQEQYAAAAPIFEKLAAADPSNLQARELLASCRLSLEQFEPALVILGPLIEVEPDNPGVRYMQGIAFTRLKRSGEAQAAFTQMMGAANTAQASFLMGKASYETGDFERAADFFSKALAADPALEGAHRELGKTLTSLHRDDDAERELRKAGSADPEALYFLGALLSQTRPKEAIALLNRARELTPDFWGPLYYLGRIAVEQHRPNDAVPLLERAAKLKPQESAIPYQMGKALQQQGKPAEARAAFARVKELKDQALNKEMGILSPEPAKPK
jgi:tetratricopeptide (TPR) repeat protein